MLGAFDSDPGRPGRAEQAASAAAHMSKAIVRLIEIPDTSRPSDNLPQPRCGRRERH
jgi:hypothetical protein